MAFNGSGVFLRLYNWVNDAAANIKIRADRMDAEFNGIATGLTNCITKDGQTTITANLPMAGYKHTGVANAALSNEYAAYGQLTAALAAITLDSLSDVVLTATASGDFIYYNGTNWVNVAKTVVPIDGIKTTGASGVILKNSAGTTVLTVGASAGTVTATAGNLTVAGTIVSTGSATVVSSLNVSGNSTAAGVITLAEDTDNGTNKVTISPPQSITSDYTVTLPSTAGALALSSEIPTTSAWATPSVNPTVTNAGTIVTQAWKVKRIGDTLYLRGGFVIASNPASPLQIGMPDSLTIDHAKVPIVNANRAVVGNVGWSGNNAGAIYVTTDGTNNYMSIGLSNVASGFSTAANTSAFSVGTTIYVDAAIPISGWA